MSKISIITASYNYENYIKETIESVIKQTFQDWEMIIVDDGSKDNSIDVIKTYCEKDCRIKLYQHKNGINKGLIETLQLGISKAQGEWIVFLESDDSITPNYIEEKLKIVEKYHNVKFIFNDVNYIGDEEYINNLKEWHFNKIYKRLNSIQFPANIVKEFKKKNMVFTFSVVMLKKDILNDLKYDATVPKLLDYYLWTQLAYKYDFYYINKKLTNWRIHSNSYINESTNPYKGVYFLDVQIADNISGGKNKFMHRLNAYKNYMKIFKRQFIRIHLKDNEITIFGKNIHGEKERKISNAKSISCNASL